MSWSLGYDSNWNRDVGYGVPAYCDYPGCKKEIDRGLAYICGGDMYGGEKGCGLFFCEDHRDFYNKRINGKLEYVELCYRCGHYKKPYTPSSDHPKWIKHKLTHESWARWREENPEIVINLIKELINMKRSWFISYTFNSETVSTGLGQITFTEDGLDMKESKHINLVIEYLKEKHNTQNLILLNFIEINPIT